MTKKEIKEIIKQVMAEETEYQKLFKTMLDKSGKDINSMSDEEKKKFFTAVDKAYKAKSEGKLVGYNENNQKKKINESVFIGILSTIFSIILGKLIFYWIGLLKVKIDKLTGFTKTTKDVIKDITNELSNNKSFFKNVEDLLKANNGTINVQSAQKIVKFSEVQKLIDKYTKGQEDIFSTDVEDGLKKIFIDAWTDRGLMDKIKNDIKR
jgi:rubrerythrin